MNTEDRIRYRRKLKKEEREKDAIERRTGHLTGGSRRLYRDHLTLFGLRNVRGKHLFAVALSRILP